MAPSMPNNSKMVTQGWFERVISTVVQLKDPKAHKVLDQEKTSETRYEKTYVLSEQCLILAKIFQVPETAYKGIPEEFIGNIPAWQFNLELKGPAAFPAQTVSCHQGIAYTLAGAKEMVDGVVAVFHKGMPAKFAVPVPSPSA